MSNIRKYIDILTEEGSDRANISKIVRSITSFIAKPRRFSREPKITLVINRSNINKGILVYGMPLTINSLDITYTYSSGIKLISIALNFFVSHEYKTKLIKAANHVSRSTEDLSFEGIVQDYIAINGLHRVKQIINELNIGFSSNALHDLIRYKSDVDVDIDLNTKSYYIMLEFWPEPSNQIMNELDRAIRYKNSMDDFDN